MTRKVRDPPSLRHQIVKVLGGTSLRPLQGLTVMLLTERVTGPRLASPRRLQSTGHLDRLETAPLPRRTAEGGGKGALADQTRRVTDSRVRLRENLRPGGRRTAVRSLVDHLVLPEADDRALQGLEFSAALPRHLAEATLSERCADLEHAALALSELHRFSTLV
jgi:hypothetical protein